MKVAANGPIGGVLRFDLPGIGVAGVGASQPVRDALFPARRQAGGIATALTIRNLGEEALGVSCRLMSGGMVLEAVEISLEANGQEARYIEELFTGTDTSDFVGSVRCTAAGLFTGIAVELDEGNRIFTTLPVVPVARTGGEGQGSGLDFAHFANGDGIVSGMVFVNLSTQPSGPAPPPFIRSFVRPVPSSTFTIRGVWGIHLTGPIRAGSSPGAVRWRAIQARRVPARLGRRGRHRPGPLGGDKVLVA